MGVLLVALFFVIAGCQRPETASPETSSSTEIGGKFAPEVGTLLIIGQDLNSIADYTASVGVPPGGVTTYTNMSEGQLMLYGLEGDADWGAGLMNASSNLVNNPDAALAIGLYLVDATGESLINVAEGKYDDVIDRLGKFISDANRPVFLRIGYEFDGPWNQYNPDQYVDAYRHIVDRLRETEVTGFASVWQSATSGWGTFNNHSIELWYPGDEYVDWMGSSYFIYDSTAHQTLLNFARLREKPVMIAEASPQGYDLDELTYSGPTDGSQFTDLSPEEIWTEWFEPYFDFINSNSDVIRAVAYINADWNSQPMWSPDAGNGYWGDSRVQANDYIRDRWIEKLEAPLWIHGGPDLLGSLNYETDVD